MRADDRHCSILIVEDEPGLRDVLSVALEADGYRVATCPDGRAAMKHLRSTGSTCLIVLDLMLPVMNGRVFRDLQLRDRSLAWIPVIVVSGAFDAVRDAHELGASAFVRKPVDVDELRATVARVTCARHLVRREQRQARA